MTQHSSAADNEPQAVDNSSDLREGFVAETMAFPGISPAQAESILKRLGGGVAEKHRLVEGVGFRAVIDPESDGVSVEFRAHEEILDDLIRRFEDMADREL